MRRSSVMIMAVLVFLGGAAVGIAVAKKITIESTVFVGKTPEEASDALLGVAQTMAGDGSWENIHLARVYYLSGREEEGQAIIDRVLGGKAEAGDWIRAGRVYYQAGDWDKAKGAFGRVRAEGSWVT